MMALAPRIRLNASQQTLGRLLDETKTMPFSYPDAGASRGVPPTGYRSINESIVAGHGEEAFARLVNGILGWYVHRDSGVRVLAAAPVIAAGVDVALGAKSAGAFIVMTCRVVYVVDEPRRKGFGYGSLPGHPEAGEESFVAELNDDQTVTFTVGGFSRPGTVFTTMVSPIARILAGRAIHRYLQAAKAIAAG